MLKVPTSPVQQLWAFLMHRAASAILRGNPASISYSYPSACQDQPSPVSYSTSPRDSAPLIYLLLSLGMPNVLLGWNPGSDRPLQPHKAIPSDFTGNDHRGSPELQLPRELWVPSGPSKQPQCCGKHAGMRSAEEPISLLVAEPIPKPLSHRHR